MHLAEQGEGPLLLLCHGFPESWYSWRHQLSALANWVNPTSLPSWLTEADLDIYADQFKQAGYRGGLNWYRNIDRNWELMAPLAGLKITVPALLIAGDRDLVLAFRGMDQVIANLPKNVPKLQKTLLLPDAAIGLSKSDHRR